MTTFSKAHYWDAQGSHFRNLTNDKLCGQNVSTWSRLFRLWVVRKCHWTPSRSLDSDHIQDHEHRSVPYSPTASQSHFPHWYHSRPITACPYQPRLTILKVHQRCIRHVDGHYIFLCHTFYYSFYLIRAQFSDIFLDISPVECDLY